MLTPLEALQSYLAQKPQPELELLEFFRPFHDPEMLDLFPKGQPMEFSFFQNSPASLDFCDMWPTCDDVSAGPYMPGVTELEVLA